MANCNADNLIGKVFLKNPGDVKMPFCDNFRIIDAKDERTYSKIKPDAWIMELWSERDILSFGSAILGLPNVSEVLSDIKEDLSDFEE